MALRFFKGLLKGSVLAAGAGAGSAYVLFYLLSHKNGNVDFVLSDDRPETEENAVIRIRRENDYEWLTSQSLEHFHITSDDGLKLHACLLPASKPSDKYVLAVHGYRCFGTKEFDSIARFYHENDVNVFMIDHRASGESEGKYITYGAKEHEDCLKWIDFMLLTFGRNIKISLHGCSMGSATVMMMLGCNLPENVKFAVSDCGYSTLKEQLYFNFKQYKLPADICYPLYCQAAKLVARFDPDEVCPIKSLENSTIPVIFAHGEADNFVPYEMGPRNYEACTSEQKVFISVPDAEHVQAFQRSDEQKNMILQYIKKYM